MLKKIKKLIPSQQTLKKSAKWLLLAIVLLAIIWGVRACSSVEAKKKEVYRIGRDSGWYPVQLFGKDKNLVAFTNDLITVISDENDLRFQWGETSPTNLVEGLVNGTYDFILTTMRPNIVNQEHYDFSELLFQFGPVLIVRQGSEMTSLEDMNGQTIGIPSNFSPIFNAVRRAGANDIDFLIVTYENMNRALDALVNDQIDGVIMQALPAYTITQGLYAGKLKVVTPPLNDEGLRFASLKNSRLEDIIDLIDGNIDTMRANGAYNALIAKWNLIDPETNYWQPKAKKAQQE